MPGVFRDPSTNTYRYYTVNEYEERRRKEWDREYGYDREPRESPPPAWTYPPAPEPLVATPPVESTLVDPSTVVWQQTPEANQVLQELNAAAEILNTQPPEYVGQNPAFDALYDRLPAETASYRQAVETLLALEPMDPPA